MKKVFQPSIKITPESAYNYQSHQIHTITERLPLDATSIVLETPELKLALGNLFESIVILFAKLNSTYPILQQVATLEAQNDWHLSKKTPIQKLIDFPAEKIKGGIRCDYFTYQEDTQTAFIVEIKWGKSQNTIQHGFATYSKPLIQRFQEKHNFPEVLQYTFGIMPFKTNDFQVHEKQKYICFPLTICDLLTQNPKQIPIIKDIVTDILSNTNAISTKQWSDFQIMLNMFANQSQIHNSQSAQNTIQECLNKIPDYLNRKAQDQVKTVYQNNLPPKINCLLLEFLCKLSRIQDDKKIPHNNTQILEEVEYLTEIINNLSKFTSNNLSLQDTAEIYQTLFIAVKKFKLKFEEYYFQNTNNSEDYYSTPTTQAETQILETQIQSQEEYKELILAALNLQTPILKRTIIQNNFTYSNYHLLNFLHVKHPSPKTIVTNQSKSRLEEIYDNSKKQISVTEAEIDIHFKTSQQEDIEDIEEDHLVNKKVLDFNYLIPFKNEVAYPDNEIIPHFTNFNFQQALTDYNQDDLKKLSHITWYCLQHHSFMCENVDKFYEIPSLFLDFINIHKGHTQNSRELRLNTLKEIKDIINTYNGPITHLTKPAEQLELNLFNKRQN